MNGERTHAQALVVTIIASAVGLSLVIFTAAAAWTLVNKDLTLSASQTAVLSTAFGALIGILGTYIGVGRGQQLAEAAAAAAQSPPTDSTTSTAPATAAAAATAVPGQSTAQEQASTTQQTMAALGPKEVK